MAKLKPGDPLSAISAREYNRHVDVADWYERTQRLGGGGNAAASGLDGTLARVKNSTGSDIRQYDPVGLGAPAVTLSDGYMIFAAATPSAASGVWGVAIDPIPNGEMGRVKLAGTAPAYVTIGDTSHQWANVSGSATLESVAAGGAEIVYQPGSTGEQLCCIRIGNSQQSATAHGRLITWTNAWGGTIPASGDVYLRIWDADTVTQSAATPIGTYSGADFYKFKSLVDGMLLVTVTAEVDYAVAGASTDGALISCRWESGGTWLDTDRSESQSYVRYPKGWVTNTCMLEVIADMDIWCRLSTALGYFWGTPADLTVGNVAISMIHLADDLILP